MANRLGSFFTMGIAMLLACAGVALAQPTESDPGQGEDLVAPASSLDAGEVIPNRYIVVLEENVASPASVARDLAGQLDFETTYVYDDALEGFAAKIPAGDLSAVGSDPRVDFVAKDRVVKASADQVIPTGINRVDADASSTAAGDHTGEVDADIAILDSGIYKTHSDLNIAGGRNCVGEDKTAWSDGYGHGTHVAGTAAAKDDSIGVVGVAPGARLWAVKVLDNKGSGSISSAICGIDWVTGKNTDADDTNNIEVANMSFGATVNGHDRGCGWTSGGAVAKMHKAICNSVDAGVTYSVAAGNVRDNFAKDIPASFNQVLTVTAMADFNGEPGGEALSTCGRNVDDTFAKFSNYTTPNSADAKHTIAAPGVCIYSTWSADDGYKTISGTSMASPHVAGTAALCIATSATTGKCTGGPADVKADLRADAADNSGPSVTPYYGFFGDPNDPVVRRGITLYYGYLEYAGGY